MYLGPPLSTKTRTLGCAIDTRQAWADLAHLRLILKQLQGQQELGKDSVV
jgi:hypothetical protein